jgi:hypothetical protein
VGCSQGIKGGRVEVWKEGFVAAVAGRRSPVENDQRFKIEAFLISINLAHDAGT